VREHERVHAAEQLLQLLQHGHTPPRHAAQRGAEQPLEGGGGRMLLLLLLQLCLRLLLLLALLLLAQRALHGIERCEAAAPHDLFDGDAAHGVRVLKCTVGPFIHGWSRIVADSAFLLAVDLLKRYM
jgi:hypothetical protein